MISKTDTAIPDDVLSQTGQTNPIKTTQTDSPMQPGEAQPDAPQNQIINAQNNEAPLQSRLSNPPSRRWTKRLARWLKGIFIKRELDAEEVANLSEEKKRKLLYQQLLAESRVAEGRMIECLTRLGMCWITERGGRRTVRKVKFSKVKMEPNALWLRVNTGKLPHRVSVTQLTDQETVTNLSVAVGHKVSCQWTEEGVWYVMERASGTFGIPNHVNLQDMWDAIPASRDRLTIPLGVTFNGKMVYDSLDNMVHLLIAGTTGGGKSNFLNVIICTLVRRNQPDQIELLMVDLKGGLEFNYYDKIPHLRKIEGVAPSGIINERDGVAPLLDWVIKEGERRMKVLLEGGAKNIGEYNAHRRGGNRMTQMIVVIDEWADVKLGKGGPETEQRLANAVQRMRAVGIHIILCTQVPQREVIGTMIKANLPSKFAFNCASLQGSMSILSTGHALQLNPRGRCVWQFQDEIQIQTPYISKATILDTVAAAITGSASAVRASHDVTPEEIRDWALQENNGYLSQARVEQRYKGRGISQDQIRDWLKSWEGKTYVIGSSEYRVEPGDFKAKRARRLVVIVDEPTQTNQTIQTQEKTQ